jgi:hypothetical protein
MLPKGFQAALVSAARLRGGRSDSLIQAQPQLRDRLLKMDKHQYPERICANTFRPIYRRIAGIVWRLYQARMVLKRALRTDCGHKKERL